MPRHGASSFALRALRFAREPKLEPTKVVGLLGELQGHRNDNSLQTSILKNGLPQNDGWWFAFVKGSLRVRVVCFFLQLRVSKLGYSCNSTGAKPHQEQRCNKQQKAIGISSGYPFGYRLKPNILVGFP